MQRLNILPKLSKEYILDRVSEERIMFFYLKIPVTEENFFGNSFCNPFREDTNPTCNYYYDKNGKLRVRDFGGDLLDRLYNMDVFDVVGHIYNIDSNDRQGFKIIQNIIAKDFRIHKYENNDEEVQNLDEFLKIQKSKKTRIKVIKVVPRRWNKGDENYWYKRYGISYETLKKHRVYPVQELYVEDNKGFLNRSYIYNPNNPAYAYYGGKIAELHIWKIYFPLNKNTVYSKILTNKQFSHGFDVFLPTRIGIITKSLKDVMTLNELGIQSVSVPSESTFLQKDEIFMIKQYCDIVVSLFDYDKAGIRMAQKAKKEYNIQPLMLTRGRYGKPDYGVKDISDFREAHGFETSLKLVHQTIDYLSDRIIDINQQRKDHLWIF